MALGTAVEHETAGEEKVGLLVEIDRHPEWGCVVLKEKGMATEMQHRRRLAELAEAGFVRLRAAQEPGAAGCDRSEFFGLNSGAGHRGEVGEE